jgi:chromosome partitioning protein
MATKFITVAVRKGGAGKTATAVNLAAILAKNSHNVLIVDLDEQGNAGAAFKYESEQDVSLDEILEEGRSDIHNAISVCEEIPTLSVCRNGKGLEHIVDKIVMNRDPYFVMNFKNIFEDVKEVYDYIIFDTAPNFRPLVQAAITASDQVIVPLTSDANCIDGLNDIKSLIQNASKTFNRPIELKVLLTMANTRSQAFKATVGILNEMNMETFSEPIPIDENHKKSTYEVVPVVLRKGTESKSVKAYESLMEEII